MQNINIPTDDIIASGYDKGDTSLLMNHSGFAGINRHNEPITTKVKAIIKILKTEKFISIENNQFLNRLPNP